MSETLVKPADQPAAVAAAAPDARAAWVERVLGVSVRGPQGAAAAAGGIMGGALDGAALRGRLNEVGIAVRNARELPGGGAAAAQFARAAAAFKAGDLSGAQRLLDEAAAAVAALRPAAAAAAAGGGPSLRAVATAALEWRRVSARAQADIPALKEAVLREMEADDEFDPSDVDRVRDELDRLDVITDTVTGELADMVDDLVGAAPEARGREVAAILRTIERQEAFVRDNELVRVLGDNGVMAVDVTGPAMATLASLRAALDGVAAG